MTLRRRQRERDEQHEKMRVYDEEVSAYLGLLESRRESLYTRGGLLVASAAISTAIATSSTLTAWTALAMVLGTLSAVIGVIALWPRPTMTIDMEVIRNGIFVDERTDAMTAIADTKYVSIPKLTKHLNRTAWQVRVGFLLLVLAIGATIGHALKISIQIGAFCG